MQAFYQIFADRFNSVPMVDYVNMVRETLTGLLGLYGLWDYVTPSFVRQGLLKILTQHHMFKPRNIILNITKIWLIPK